MQHQLLSTYFPYLVSTGKLLMFSFGNIQTLCVSQPDIVKEITTCTSFDLGKASFHKELLGPLLGDGILTSNGTTWAHHRHLLAPEFYLDKVKVR